MKRGKPRALGRNSGTEKQVRDACLHFFGGFVGEGDRENVFGRDTLGDEISHAEGDGTRLASASAGED